MRIGVVGGGGVGGYLAGIAAEAGHEVVLLCRGATARVVAREGLRLRDDSGERVVSSVAVTLRASGLAGCDLVLLCVKSWQVATVARQLAPFIGARTLIVTTQNGVEAGSLAAESVGERRVLAGAVMVVAEQVAPGVFQRTGSLLRLEMGPVSPGLSTVDPLVRGAALALAQAGVEVVVSEQICRVLWRKLIFAASVSGVPTLFGVSAGDAPSSPEVDAVVREAIWEGAAVARADGASVDDADVTDMICAYEKLPSGMTSSMQRDITAGRPSELFGQTGAIVRRGAQHGVPTPVHSRILDQLSPLELRARRERRLTRDPASDRS